MNINPLGESAIPVVVNITPTTVTAGGSVTIYVQLSMTVTSDQVVSIGASHPNDFADLPTQVTVKAGENAVTFGAYTSSSATGSTTVSATANMVSLASPPLSIVLPPPPPPPM